MAKTAIILGSEVEVKEFKTPEEYADYCKDLGVEIGRSSVEYAFFMKAMGMLDDYGMMSSALYTKREMEDNETLKLNSVDDLINYVRGYGVDEDMAPTKSIHNAYADYVNGELPLGGMIHATLLCVNEKEQNLNRTKWASEEEAAPTTLHAVEAKAIPAPRDGMKH